MENISKLRGEVPPLTRNKGFGLMWTRRRETYLTGRINEELGSFISTTNRNILTESFRWNITQGNSNEEIDGFTIPHSWFEMLCLLSPSISSLELSCVMFHLKPSLRIAAIYGAYKWSKFFIYPPGEISFSSPCSYQSNSFSREWQVVIS